MYNRWVWSTCKSLLSKFLPVLYGLWIHFSPHVQSMPEHVREDRSAHTHTPLRTRLMSCRQSAKEIRTQPQILCLSFHNTLKTPHPSHPHWCCLSATGYGESLVWICRGFPPPSPPPPTLSPYSLSLFLLLLLCPHYCMVHWLLTIGLNTLRTGCLHQGPHSPDSPFKLLFLWVRKPLSSLLQCRTPRALPIPPMAFLYHDSVLKRRANLLLANNRLSIALH